MAPWGLIVRAIMAMEDVFVQRLLSSPTFHHAVRRIHRGIQEARHGRDPNEPLKRGQATDNPNKRGFLGHFIEELRLQARGKPSPPPPPPPPGSNPPPTTRK